MTQEIMVHALAERKTNETVALLLGTGLALTSMILLPAFAARLGLGASLTGALRMAIMKASSQAIRG
jgi:hypothetical protein